MPRPAVSFVILLLTAAAALTGAPSGIAHAQTARQYELARELMVRDVIVAGGVKNPRVIEAMGSTPRHEFVDLIHRPRAYYDMALPIGGQQTISSPFIVSYMTEALDPQPTDKVLEIGTGSGYQAAVLSPLVREVYSIEIVKELGDKARRTLSRLGYKNVSVLVGDGYKGWPEHAPFDKIIVTCSPEKVPQPLIDQLREGGRIVVPVGERYQQTLYLFIKKGGVLESEKLVPTLFVPMTGQAEEARSVLPDPTRPVIVNGGFEEPADQEKGLPGWYYTQQWEWGTDSKAPEGDHFVTFRNAEPGRSSSALQGFAVDGRVVGELELKAMVKYSNLGPSDDRSWPVIAVSFYDENRRELPRGWIGPYRGTSDWRPTEGRIPVPLQAREAILRIGLLGATGEIHLDNLRMTPIRRGRAAD